MRHLIISLLALTLLAPALTAAPKIYEARTSVIDSVKGVRILRLKDVKELEFEPIYGQIQHDDQKKTYGGDGKNLKNLYINVTNLDAQRKAKLTIARDTVNGLYYTLPLSTTLDTLQIEVFPATTSDNKDWNRDINNKFLVNWIINAPVAEEKGAAPAAEAPTGSGGAENDETEVTETEAGAETAATAPAMRVLDWIFIVLFALFIILTFVFHSRNRRPEIADPTDELDSLNRKVADLNREISELKNTNAGLRMEVSKLRNDCTTLQSSLGHLQNAIRKAPAPKPEQKPEQTNQTFQEIKPAGPRDLGPATTVNNAKALELSNSSQGMFQITANGEQFTFTIRPIPEIMSMFETNPGMLDLFMKSGIITYESLPQNARIKEITPGTLANVDGRRFNVITPLAITFQS